MAAIQLKYSLGSPQEHIEMCKIHDLPIDVICEDCDEFICGKCAKTDHRDHDWNTLFTAASQKRRGLLKFLTKIKEKDLPGIDGKIEKMSNQISEKEKLCETEIKKLQKHYDEIISKLSEIKEHMEQQLRDNLKKKNEKLNILISEIDKKKREIAETIKFMEENNSTMSDDGFIDIHSELTQLLSGLDVDMNKNTPSVRYSKGEVSDAVLENLIGKYCDLNDISLTETSSFKYGEEAVILLRALCEDQCYIKQLETDYIEQVNKEGEKKHQYNITANELCVTDIGDVYFTDFSNNTISCLSPSGSVSTVISTDPLAPAGICQSVDGGLLVTLRDNESDRYKLESHSRRLVRHITVTGDVIHEFEYQEDGQSRLFTFPRSVTQNSNSDICVVNRTNPTADELVIMSTSGRMKSVYRGRNLTEDFWPGIAVCDSLCNILVTDMNDVQIHLLSPDGEFLKFLLTENKVYHPTRLSLYKSTLWVGYKEGLVKVFQYTM
ncbi:uncharacterized protein LOC133187004 [Saccostrea echinata]|uniref:uncharacterized protein LOC133187004 n=1 Tax=Saccostrea echinata TaxID=191078 RepID=UPI002A83B67B|nr:uncharacterized protein LOC133187004 [Saccostrea echinata]